jgi:hypothetical protein
MKSTSAITPISIRGFGLRRRLKALWRFVLQAITLPIWLKMIVAKKAAEA